MYIVFTFASTHQALAVEREVVIAEIPHQIIPTPRGITANCGLSMRIASDKFMSVQALISQLNIQTDAYRVPQERGGLYERIELEEG